MSAPQPQPPQAPHQNAPVRQDAEAEIDLTSLWLGVRARLPVVLLVAAGLALAAYLWARAQPVVYEASASVIASSAQSQIGVVGGSVVSALPLGTVEQVLSSPLILRPLIAAVQENTAIAPAERRNIVKNLERELSSASGDSRKKTVSVTADQGTGENSVYTLRARAPSADAARRLADAASRLLLTWDAGRTSQDVRLARTNFTLQLAQVDRRLALPGLSTLERQTLVYRRATMQDNLAQLAFLESVRTGSLKSLANAVTPVKPASPSPLRNAALLGVLGLFLGVGVAALRTVTHPFIQTEDDLLALGLPVLGVSPPAGRKWSQFAARQASGFLQVRLLSALAGTPHPVVLVAGITASGRTDGGEASRVVAQLALGLAESGSRVLIAEVGGGLGGSRPQHPLLAGGQAKPTWQPLEGLQVAEVRAGVHLLPADSGPAHGPVWLAGPELGQRLRTWGQSYDLVLLDSPPLLDQAEGLKLGQHADGVVLVAGAGRTSLGDLKRVLRAASAVGLPLLGCVLDQSPAPSRRAQARLSPSPDAAVTAARTREAR